MVNNILQCFLTCSHEKWNDISNLDFDFIVLGSGLAGLAFIDQMLKMKPSAKILLLERGGKYMMYMFTLCSSEL